MDHFYKKIQGWFAFSEAYVQAVREAPKSGARFVEIGAWRGRSSAFMGVEIANSGKQIEFNVVDHFLGSEEQIKRQEPELVAGNLFETFKKNVAPVLHLMKVHQMSSEQAANGFPVESLDFVLIDGAHDYHSVMKDLTLWWWKVKPGCVIAGDDYGKPGVHDAVNHFFGSLKLIGLLENFGGVIGKGPHAGKKQKCWKLRKPIDYSPTK